MHDRGKILMGVGVFLVLVLLPLWYGLARGGVGSVPELEVGTTEKSCVRDAAWMRGSHMDLLDVWRDEVVRGTGDTFDVGMDGIRRPKSLTRTCLGCHASPSAFCDRCHDSMGVAPDCWNCHTVPKEVAR